jgi:hypothetical protein
MIVRKPASRVEGSASQVPKLAVSQRRASTPLGVIALKGAWLNDHAFAMDLRMIGGDKDQRWILSFDGEKPKLRGKGRGLLRLSGRSRFH